MDFVLLLCVHFSSLCDLALVVVCIWVIRAFVSARIDALRAEIAGKDALISTLDQRAAIHNNNMREAEELIDQ